MKLGGAVRSRAGSLAIHTLRIASSEYVDNSSIAVTDTIPNGICPLDTLRNYVTGSPPDCRPGTVAPSVPYQSVTQNPDGTLTVVWDPIDMAHNGTATITFQARMRTTYTGGSLAGEPTATGDTFTKTAEEVGTSTPIPRASDNAPTTVTDTSSVSGQGPVGQPAGVLSHALASACMMKGSTPLRASGPLAPGEGRSPGALSTWKSATSCPVHLPVAPSHHR